MSLRIVRRTLPNWGWAYGPPGDGPFPAILLLHGSDGRWSGWSARNAGLLASQGFLALPFGYSNGGNAWNAGDIADIPLDRTVHALGALRNWRLSGEKIGLYGVSRGAEHALLLVSLMARDAVAGLPDAVAVHSAPDVICGAFNAKAWRDAGDPGWQPWDPAKRAWIWRGSSDGLLPTAPIEIERYNGPLFLSHGTRDTTWSVEMTRRLSDRLNRHGRTPEVHLYEGEDHGLSSEGENRHYELLTEFLTRHLA
ncbi:MAG: prolyl oligopeptidase family serine peptidase [Bradyrhizobium sp.]|uniref:alpha/beta hydrolase family protein n=1 Tax=Bradyrhizobium sp. TaxID=376 RepID=UPI0025B89214|nr:acyl-CoA thioester hydrolase/BAAT C-terminal domain-containing protein [Bradyrhizobium sp.]MBI5264780.1 prolyl oligopeptidase family serine peptidase [Bradyrhizobium sp.]